MTATETRPSRTGRLRDHLFTPVDAASLAAFRILFGALMLVAVMRFFVHGWIATYFLEPRNFFTYYGFDWVKPWPGIGMYVHFAMMAIFAFGVMVGFHYRACIAGFGLLFLYAHLIDKTNYLNHYYLVVCLCGLMTLLPLDRVFSVDAWRQAGGGPRSERSLVRSISGPATVPAWMLWLLRAQLACVYIFGGIAKLKYDWLVDAQPLRMWLAANSEVPWLGALFTKAWFAHVFSIAGAGFDLLIVPALLWARTRWLAYLALVFFHLMTARLFQLGMFPWIMMVSSLLFLQPDWPRRLLVRLPESLVKPFRRLSSRRRAIAAMQPVIEGPSVRPCYVLPLICLYLSVQIAMPLRHWLYPGNVCWTEQGFRFSWNVMLMEKNGSADFFVTEPSTGRTWEINNRDYLTPYQIKMMASQPDMILQFAHIIAADFRHRGIVDPQVRVEAFAALNGRRNARLINQHVDLAAQVDTLGSMWWIEPLR